MGFISSGTYGRVYKARLKSPTPSFDPTRPTRPGDLEGQEGELYAIKKFKPDKEGEVVTYTGISQSAIREIAVSAPMEWEEEPACELELKLTRCRSGLGGYRSTESCITSTSSL